MIFDCIMKILHINLILFAFVIILFSCGNSNQSSSSDNSYRDSLPQISFISKHFSFGEIDKNNIVTYDFLFKNIGDNPLLIYKVDVSCGCLSAIYTERPILKDSMGFVRVRVDPNKVEGHFIKNVFVKSNATEDVVLLKVEGTIIN